MPDMGQWFNLTGTAIASGMLLAGMMLLFMGVKFVRPVYAVIFTFLGATAGWVTASIYRPDLAWVIAVGGAAVVGLLGFLFYRIWIILTFGVAISLMAAGAWYVTMAPDDVHTIAGQTETIWMPYLDYAQAKVQQEGEKSDLVSALAKTALLEAQGQQLYSGLPARWEGWRQVVVDSLKPKALGGSIAAAVGLTLGLIIAGMSWRLAAVLLTALWGAKWAVLGMAGLCAIYRPSTLEWARQMGSRAWMLPAGLLLMGLAVQGFLARGARNRELQQQQLKEQEQKRKQEPAKG